MAKVWVRLLAPRQVDHAGGRKRLEAGDWWPVGEQLARSWIAEGCAEIPGQRVSHLAGENWGLVIMGGYNKGILEQVDGIGEIPVTESEEPTLAYAKTLLWHPRVPLRPEMIPVGVSLLDKWQMAVPLWDYEKLACHVANEPAREKTKAVIHDLRVPLYDTSLMFVKRCGDTKKLIEAWVHTDDEDADRLSFLRALYLTKPLILALPITWTGKQGPPEN